MRIPKRESELKAALREVLLAALPGFVLLQHADLRYGVPDWSITGFGRTTWLEFKHATPTFDSSGIQELTCMRLANAGNCRYVIWQENGKCQRTMIVHPREVHRRTGWALQPEKFCVGFDHRWVVEYLRGVHTPC